MVGTQGTHETVLSTVLVAYATDPTNESGVGSVSDVVDIAKIRLLTAVVKATGLNLV